MILSFSTGSLYGFSLRRVFREVAQAGFEGVELLVAPEVLGRGPAAIRSLARDHGLAIEAVHRSLFPIPGWNEHRGGLARMVDLARVVGARLVVIHPPRWFRGSDRPRDQRFQRDVDRAVGEAGPEVRIAIENLSRKTAQDAANPLNDPAGLRDFAEAHGLALTLDTSHAASFGHDILALYPSFRDRLANVHLSDFCPRGRWAQNRLLANHFVQHQVPGTGVLPLEELLARLVADDYHGNVSLEVGPIPTRAWWRPALRRNLAAMAGFVRTARRRESRVSLPAPASASESESGSQSQSKRPSAE